MEGPAPRKRMRTEHGGPGTQEKYEANTSMDSKVVAGAVNAFGLRLAAALAAEDGPTANVLVCPASIAMTLAMAAAGATSNSRCEQELNSLIPSLPLCSHGANLTALFKSVGDADPQVQLVAANAQFSRASILKEYSQFVAEHFEAEVKPLTTEVPINEWVKSSTNGLIPEILNELDPLVVNVLLNVIYFKGTWTEQFDPKRTIRAEFHPSTGPAAPCQMMRCERDLKYGETSEFQIAQLDYGRTGRFAATVLLPKEGLPHGVLDMLLTEAGQQPDVLKEWLGVMGKWKTEVDLSLPKFKVEYGARDLCSALSLLGLTDAFGSKDGPFLKMTDDVEVHLGKVLHKAVLEVNEEGTEAAAVAAMMCQTLCIRPGPPKMVVNRPFLFLVQDLHSSLVLFLGKIAHVATT
mmetsp:Transcript_35900/g.68855  ORF Transcript_35900/g.68855 Transcript_35900/m.68855 type:complete len:407 (-) Transcript_35900:332-1552(-)